MSGEFDPAVFDPLAKSLEPGDTFLDVGANIGYYSVRALQHIGKTGNVYAFEVDDRPLHCLRKTIAREALHNLHLCEAAVADLEGGAFLLKSAESGNSRIVDNSTEGTKVPIITLDRWYFSTGRPRVNAIKIDIEGAEVRALRGARQLIAEQRPLIICEAWGGTVPLQSPAAHFLSELNYEVETLRGVHSPTLMAHDSR